MKKCSKCGIQKEDENFWKRNNRKSGTNSECKECASKRRINNRKENLEEFREKAKKYYNQNREHLISLQCDYQRRSKKYREYQNERSIKKRKECDPKFIARTIVSLALRAKMIIRPDECSLCMETAKIEAHHPDYMKPLDIQWLCIKCHRNLHKEERKLLMR